MGDRGNIKIVSAFEGAPPLYFYTHWTGSALPSIVKEALRKVSNEGRLNDESYASRIIFCTLLQGDFEGSSGYGISTWESGDASTIVTIDFKKSAVDIAGVNIPFDTFVNL